MNLFKTMTAVPMNKGKVDVFKNHFFNVALDSYSFVFTVAVDEDQDIVATQGSWSCLSPLEPLYALIETTFKDVKNDASDEVIRSRRTWILFILFASLP